VRPAIGISVGGSRDGGGRPPAAARANAAAGGSPVQPEASAIQLWRRAEILLAHGDIAGRDVVQGRRGVGTAGGHLMVALATVHVSYRQQLPEQANTMSTRAEGGARFKRCWGFTRSSMSCPPHRGPP